MPDIKQLSENGTQFYPETHVTAVIDGNGASVDELLSGKQNTLVSGTNIKTINNTSLLGSGNISITSSSGTVTSVKMTVPTGLSVSGSPITTSGTLAVSLATGYKIPTTTELSNLAPKASPALTGTPTAPTATAGTNTTQIATTAFVQSAVSSAGGGTVSSVGMTVPTGLSVSGSPVTSSGTLAVSLATGYTIPTTTEMNGKEVTTNKVTSLSSTSTDTQYPSAKCVYNGLAGKQSTIDSSHKLSYSLVDTSSLTQKTSVAGTEKVPISDSQYLTPSQIATSKQVHLSSESQMPASPDSDTLYLIDDDGGSTYTLPIASASTLGGVKVGSTLSINSTSGEMNVGSAFPKYVLLADEAAYNALSTKDSGTLYLIPKA